METVWNYLQRVTYVIWHVLRRNNNFLGFAFAALIFSGVSFYTTYNGLSEYGFGGTSLYVSLGLQSFMFFLALTLSATVADEKLREQQLTPQSRGGFLSAPRMFALAGFLALGYLFYANLIDGFVLAISAIIIVAVAIAIAHPVAKTISLVYFFVMSLSVMFSFDAIYSWVSPPEERFRDASIRARSDVGTAISDLEKKLTKKSQTESELLLIGDASPWNLYKSQLKKVSDQADQNALELRNSETRRINEMRTQRQQADKEVVRVTDLLVKKESELKIAELEIEPLEKIVRELSPKVIKLEAEFQTANLALETRKNLITSEEAGENGGDEGCKAFCRYYKFGTTTDIKKLDRYKLNPDRFPEIDSLSKLEGNVSEIKAKLGPLKKWLDQTQSDLQTKRNQYATIPAELKGLQNEIGDAEAAVIENTRASTEIDTASPQEEVSAASLNIAVSGFESEPSSDNFDKLVSECNQINDSLAALNVQTNCSGEFATKAAGFFAFERRRQDFEQACSGENLEAAANGAESSTPETGNAVNGVTEVADADDLNRTSFNRLINFGRKCIIAAGADINTTDENDKLDRLQLRIDPDSGNRLAQNYEEFKDFNPQAWFAGVLAFALDSLVLFASIYGAGRKLPPGLGYGPSSSEGTGPSPNGGGGNRPHQSNLTIDQENAVFDISLKIDSEPDENDPHHIYKAKIFLRVCDDHSLRSHSEHSVIVPDWLAEGEERQVVSEMIPKYRGHIQISKDLHGNEYTVYKVDQAFYMELVGKVSEFQSSKLERQGHNPDYHPAGKRRSRQRRSVFENTSGIVDVTPRPKTITLQPMTGSRPAPKKDPPEASELSHGDEIATEPIPPTKPTPS